MKRNSLIWLSLFAIAAPGVLFYSFGKPSEVNATGETNYVADTQTAVTASTLVSGARYLLCQYASYGSAYQVLDGTSTSAKQIPFLSPSYSTLSALQSGASSLANRYVTLTHEGNSNWYLQRNSDNKYLVSNESSDLVFSSSSSYVENTNRCYFTVETGSGSDKIKFRVPNDTGLYLGTKSSNSYFDTWHDQTGSVATKDFILYRVYNQNEEATNYAQSFNTSIGGICSINGNTSLATLESAWGSMSSSWGALSSAAKTVFSSTTADSSISASAIAQCKAKYLYILGKYPSDSALSDFMNINGSMANVITDNSGTETMVTNGVLLSLSLAALGAFIGRIHCQKKKTIF